MKVISHQRAVVCNERHLLWWSPMSKATNGMFFSKDIVSFTRRAELINTVRSHHQHHVKQLLRKPRRRSLCDPGKKSTCLVPFQDLIPLSTWVLFGGGILLLGIWNLGSRLLRSATLTNSRLKSVILRVHDPYSVPTEPVEIQTLEQGNLALLQSTNILNSPPVL